MAEIDFQKRLRENKLSVIHHGKEDESYHCRNCNFSDCGIKNALKKAKIHSNKTGHTVDVYYESWRELNYYNKKNLNK